MNGLELMKMRMDFNGGKIQQDRMIREKQKTLDKAILYSYQGAKVHKDEYGSSTFGALINPNKLKPDYDDKIISIHHEAEFTTGTVFEWEGTNTKWLIYLQDLTELAYFKGDIRRCNYTISWKDEEGNIQSTYAAIRGPVETKINFVQKNKISLDEPNHSLHILMPATLESVAYFKRYAKFYLKNLIDTDTNICWRVEGFDTISSPGILEVVAVEYYSNQFEDDLDNGIAGGLVVEPEQPVKAFINGPDSIQPFEKVSYNYEGTLTNEKQWNYTSPNNIIASVQDGIITLTWKKSYSGSFVLSYGQDTKEITVKSLF